MTFARLARTASIATLAVSLSGCMVVHSQTWARLFGHRTPAAAHQTVAERLASIAKTQSLSPNAQAAESDVYYRAAAAAIYRRDYGQALDNLQIARDHAPTDVRVLNAFGVVYDKLGRFDLSHRYYAQALALDPKSAIISQNIAYSHALQDRAASEVQLAAAPAAPAPTALAQAHAPVRTQAVAANHLRTVAPGVLMLELPGQSMQAKLIPPAFTGHAVVLVDASGRHGAGESVRSQLASLGWTTQKAVSGQGPRQTQTTISYLAPYEVAAKALARTLPGPVRMQSCTSGCDSIRVTVGADALKWKFTATNAPADRRRG